MAYTFKLSHRLARLRTGAALAALSILACSGQDSDPLGLQSTSQKPTASVEVAPSDLTGAVGESSQFTAIVRDEIGAVITGRTITWTSNDTTVTRITPQGLGTAVGVGTAKISAVVDGRTGSASTVVKALPPGVVAPGNVTDLAVSATGESTITLAFTEVGNGAGQPATYLVRLAPSPMNWGVAATAKSGTCSSPLSGSSVGGHKTCTVSGLNPATAYDFQLRAFRIPSGQDTVFGGLSNVAKGVTAGAIVAAVSTVSLNPASITRQAGETSQLAVTLKDAAGNVLTGRPVTWSSSNTVVATVDATGLVRAVAAGSASVTATSEGKSGTASFTVSGTTPPPPASSYSHQPSGYSVMVENGFNTVPVWPSTLSGITGRWWANPSGIQNLSIVNVSGAPQSGPSVIQTKFPAGLQGGSAPALYGGWDQGEGGTTLSKMYISVWIKIPSPDFENQLVGTKIGYLGYARDASTALNDGYLWMAGTGVQSVQSSFALEFRQQNNVGRNLVQNVDKTKYFTAGSWHHFEILLELNSLGSANGKVKWWVDDHLIIDYSDLTYIVPGASLGFQGFKIDPVWGGIGGNRTRDDYMQVDHLYVSGVH